MDPSEHEGRLLAAAKQLATAEQRAAFLQAACGEDAQLRRRLEALLQAEEPAGNPPQPAGQVSTYTQALTTTLPEVTEKPGEQIGHYKLLQQIGEGGWGVVYLAEQEEPVKRRVALKVIKLGMDTRQVVARFEAERQALALMDHPNIAKVLDAGATENGRPYFVMELVHGIRITDYCDQNNLSTEERLKLFIAVCHAVQHAHQKGIIHRDIKPSNILVTMQDGAPVPKVIDFGIAKATAGQRLTDKTLFTAFEQFIGTPAYMSPEQAEMSGLDVDTRSDIYSLGVLLYELLTGKTPFETKRLFNVGLDEIRRIIREEEPPRPSTKISTLGAEERTTTARRRQTDPPRLIHLIRGDLDWIVMKCLEKDRTRRYDSANGLVLDIERHLSDEPVVARPPSVAYRFQKTVQRHRVAFGAAGLIFVTLAAGLAVSLWSLRQANREAARSAQVARFLKDMLDGVGPSVAQGRDTAVLRKIFDKTSERLDKELKNQPSLQADLRNTIGTVYLELGQYDIAEAMFREALAQRRKLLGKQHPEVVKPLNNLAVVLRVQGKLAEAETLSREVVALQRKLLGNEDPKVASALNNLAMVLCDQQRLAEAETLSREVLAMRKKLLGNDHPDVAGSLNNLAVVLQGQGKRGQAEAMLREALALQRKLLGNEHPDLGHPLNNLAAVLRDQGKLQEAEALHREALALRKKLLPNEHPDTATSLNNLGVVLRDQRRLTEAESLAREALAMQKKLLGHEHPDVAISLNNLAAVLQDLGKLEAAEALSREALALQQKSPGADNPDAAGSLTELTRTLMLEGKFVEAETFARECLALREKRSPDDWETFEARSLLGASLAGQKKYLGAEPLLLSGYTGMKQREEMIPVPEKRRFREALQSLVQLYEAAGKTEEAAKWKGELAARGL